MKISITRLLITVSTSICVAMLAGCSAGMIKAPKGSPTMAEVYQASQNGRTSFYNAGDSARGSGVIRGDNTALPHTTVNMSGAGAYNRKEGVVNTLNSQFPTLPNPQSLMYIFGHYAGDGQLPVPGHFIVFALYNRTHYALPAEVMTTYNDGQFVR